MEDDQWDEEVLGKKELSRPPLSTHCNVPLKASMARAALGRPAPGQSVSQRGPLKEEYKNITKIAGNSYIHFLDLSRHQFGLLNQLLVPHSPLMEMEWKQQLQGASQLWSASIKGLKDLGDLALPEKPPRFSSSDSSYLFTNYLLKCFYEEGVLSSGSPYHVPNLWWKKNKDQVSYCLLPGFSLFVTANLLLIKSKEGAALLSRDHLLILSDLASQRYLLRLLSVCEKGSCAPSFPAPKYLDSLLENGDLILHKGGNRAYKLIYGLEPYCASLLVGDIPVGHPKAQSFHQIIKTDQIDLAKALNVSQLAQARIDLLDSVKESPSLLSQIFGLYRIWGHPTIEPLEGVSALKRIATGVRMLRIEEAKAISTKFKEEFIIRYIKRFKHWPNIDCSRMSPYNVVRRAFESQGIYPRYDRTYRRASLDLLSFKQCFPVDPKFDLVEMLSDKALSLNTDELIHLLTLGRGVGSSIERSVLLKWLSSELHDPVEFLEFINKYGFPINEASIGVKEKEREGKVDARLFGLTTIFKRMYIVLTEAMLAEHIVPLFPEITMTDDEISLDKKRGRFTQKIKNRITLFTSLDFSKWNSNMREEETYYVFRDFDHLFGFQAVYTRTHEMFKNSFMYLLNGSYLPQVREGKLVADIGSWRGHLGGIEGLRQKGWTIWTVTLILLAAEEHSITLQLMGQGDNQILREMFPPDLDYKNALQVHFRFLNSLNSLLDKIGPPLKLEETWTSQDLYIYGKYMIYKGAPLPMYGKRLCRMFRLSNEDFPTLESTLSSLTANFSSALASHHHPGCLYFIYCTEVIGAVQLFTRIAYLQKSPPFEILSKTMTLRIPGKEKLRRIPVPRLLSGKPVMTEEQLIKILLLPRCLGGFPILNLPMALLRGFPDEVNLTVSSLRLIYPHLAPKFQRHISKILCPPLSPDISLQMIMEHPTALNLDVPPAPSESRRTHVVAFIKETPRITNSYFKTFVRVLDSAAEKPLLEFLGTATPFNPRVVGLIASATVEARARHIAGRLQKTKTISALAVKEGKKDIYSAVAESELNHYISVVRLNFHSNQSPIVWHPRKCSMAHTMELRNTSWQREIVGVDCVSPYEFMYLEKVHPSRCCPPSLELDKGYVAVRYAKGLTQSELRDPLTTGPHAPYRGSVTRQKITGFGDKLAVQADPLLTKTLKLFSLIGWTTPESGNLACLIKALLQSRTDLDPSLVVPDADQIAGSIHHRLQDERTGHGGAVVNLPNYGSKLVFDTFPLVAYSKGSTNVNLMFQSFMSSAIVLLGWDLHVSEGDPDRTVHLHVKMSCCIRPVDERFIDCPSEPIFPLISDPNNPYLFIKAERAFPPHLSKNVFPSKLTQTRDPDICQQRLSALLAQEIVDLLSPSTWNLRSGTLGEQSLVINWALRCPLQYMLEHVAFLLVVYFIPSIRKSSLAEFLMRVHDHVLNSPLIVWTQLSNLLHCPNFHHELVSQPYPIVISGNPCMSPEILAFNIRAKVAAIILMWTDPSETNSHLKQVTICASSFCGMNYHPAIQLMVLDYLTQNPGLNILELRLEIMKFLNDPLFVSHQSSVSQLAAVYFNRGRELITCDTLDTLSKLAARIPEHGPSVNRGDVSLPPAVIVLARYSRDALIITDTSISPIPKGRTHGYQSMVQTPSISTTTESFKGLSLLQHLPIAPEGTLLCLGDGAGGFTWAALRSFPNIHVFYNSLSSPDTAIQQAPSIPFLPALAGWPDLEQRLCSLTMVNEEICDVTHPLFISVLKKHQSQFGGILCDAECENYLDGRSSLKLSLSVAEVCEQVGSPWVIFKTYAYGSRLLRQTISIFLSKFKEVQVLRSYFSNIGNTEVYIFAYEPGRSLKLNIMGHHLSGYQVYNEVESFIDDTILPALQGSRPWDWDLIQPYSLTITPDMDVRIFKQLLLDLPFLCRGDTVVYPHSINTWIGTTTMKKPAQPSLSRKSLEHTMFSRILIQRWILAYLVIWGNAAFETGWNLDRELSDLYLIWYRLRNGSWEFSLYSTQSLIPDTRDIKIWKLSKVLTAKHLKIINKGIGLTLMAGLRVQIMSPGIHRGNLDISGRRIQSQFYATSEWIRDNIQVSFTPPPSTPDHQEVRKTVKEILKEKREELRKYWKHAPREN
ncbi:RNA-dependent RNA polymerase [hymenopteran rhabdo-related virus 109]|uniref:Replicase n=1 Tax=hymenopteran rhabdo-related virus 109 TaxID=2847803 RepID=A0A7D7IU63_9RHAB|nr:RNA-dependent RNA polymerase [hymenopteran rhabdo-related virus 109]QMP82144.1 RNA-dependent RNA polymerase [hymenopteran rhabdo-related virus 109]